MNKPIIAVAMFSSWQSFPVAEHWGSKPPQTGDHIRVSRGIYNHHGIYVSHQEVIHFSSYNDDNVLGEGNKVIQTTLSQFLRGSGLEVKIYNNDEWRDVYPVTEIVRWARASLGDSGYHLVFNNCEHFANYCTLGRFHSQQVNNVFRGVNNMSWLDSLGGMVSSAVSYVGGKIFGDGTYKGGNDNYRDRDRGDYGFSGSSSTLYEPDKVKVAKIESAAKLKLAGAENDRIVLWKETQLELAEFNAKMEAAMIEARARGFYAMQQALMGMLKEVNVVAEERLVLIESASMGQVKQVEDLYAELERDIKHDNFMTEKLPQLMELLREFPEGSDMRDSYRKGVDLEIATQFQFKTQQMQQLEARRKSVLDSVSASKQLIHQHINEVVSLRVRHMEQVMLEYKQPVMPVLAGIATPQALTNPQVTLSLADGSKTTQ